MVEASLLPADEVRRRDAAPSRRRARRPARDLSAAMGETYEEAGVDIAAGEEAVERIKAKVRSTFRPEVIGDIGGFGGLFAFAGHRYRHPVLVSSTDGVGTKALDRPGDRPLRHDRHRPGGHVRRRPRLPGRRAALLPRLHRGRQARPRPHRAARRGRRRGLPPGRLRARSAARWPSTPAPWSPASSTSSASPSGWSSATSCSPATRVRPGDVLHRAAVARPALQRLLAGPPGAASTWPAAASTSRPTRAPATAWPTSCSSRR